MPRDFFCRAAADRISASGSVITAIQVALRKAGANDLAPDGVFGGQTQSALNAFQNSCGLPATGTVNDDTWTRLMGVPEPAIFTRCLQVTASFEGTGFSHVVGNFDGAGITWGIIGFTLLNGELGSVLGLVAKADPGLLERVFGKDEATVMQICAPATSSVQKLEWANSISVGRTKDGIAEPWNGYFIALGEIAAVQQIEIDKARSTYWSIALRDSSALGMTEELDFLLLFDTAVQNGGLGSKGRLQRVKDAFATQKPATAEARRSIVAQVVADTSSPTYSADVLNRKKSIAEGAGRIHGASYLFSDWGLLDGYSPTNPQA
ncbi:MAG TPA: peptidoglycan-binding domain-containing protein [Rhizomicrobium sp.]|jgi:peptidoglycan hydrolase-like protein with peptidoglycan-binding domain|nr:peptidoglycan-binding domain-containing protein [Rhizomicrobium sp.]